MPSQSNAHRRPTALTLSDEQLLQAASERDIPITDAALLRQALTHKSAVEDTPLCSNERLEYLGDAILGNVIARCLFDTLPQHSEGSLAKARSLIVCKTALAEASTRLDITPLLTLGATEEAMGGRSRASLIADAYEALVAVIAITKGADAAEAFILRTLAQDIEHVRSTADYRDPKTTLQEWCQGHGHALPDYQIVAENGRPHDRTFVAEVFIDSAAHGRGQGKTKKDAQQAAAEQAIASLRSLSQL